MISDDYIMEFVKGKGYFSVAISKVVDRKPRKTTTKAVRQKPDIGFRVKPSFRITAAKDEEEILYKIKEKLGVDNIYTQYKKRDTPNGKPISHYYCQSITELEKIVAFFHNKEFYALKVDHFNSGSNVLKSSNPEDILQKKDYWKFAKSEIKWTLS